MSTDRFVGMEIRVDVDYEVQFGGGNFLYTFDNLMCRQLTQYFSKFTDIYRDITRLEVVRTVEQGTCTRIFWS